MPHKHAFFRFVFRCLFIFFALFSFSCASSAQSKAIFSSASACSLAWSYDFKTAGQGGGPVEKFALRYITESGDTSAFFFTPSDSLHFMPDTVFTFTGLPFGRLVFEVFAVDPRGVFSDACSSLDAGVYDSGWFLWIIPPAPASPFNLFLSRGAAL